MYRTVMEQLQKWKAKKHRKPLVIRGARQVGKTWLMKAFGAAEYDLLFISTLTTTNGCAIYLKEALR